MNVEVVCKKRTIDRYNIQTPLLVPSFSSAFSVKIKDVHDWIQDYITPASLVSSYDIYHNYIDSNRIWVSDIVFIDSGTYEYDSSSNSKNQKEWSPSMHHKVLKKLVPLTNTVLVNYDIKGSVEQQLENAIKFRNLYRDYAVCFLCKPISRYLQPVDLDLLFQNEDILGNFDILGFTEKELGNSLVERCERIVKIRECLNSMDLNLPIHVFGCLDPLCIISYFLCGADIFDGLSWLRYGFHNDLAIYPNNYAFYKKCWAETDLAVLEKAFIFNLGELANLRKRMINFTQDYDFALLGLQFDILSEVKNLTSHAGVEYKVI